MIKRLALKERGQLSIFLGISLLIVVTLLGFIINVGLFVKAKINLQNAVDSAAWAGAATQARHLSNIGHLNWEMRNTYKEWMFKYYVLGQMGLTATSAAELANSSDDWVNFRTRPFYAPGSRGTSGNQTFDPSVVDAFNAPSICIHFGTEHDICQVYDVPGIPRFQTVGLPGISEQHESFLNTIAQTKSKDCSARSDINLSNATIWAYGTKIDPRNEAPGNTNEVPLVAPHRTGAWIQAIELSLRMRNLEMIVNRPPLSQGICFDPSRAFGACQTSALQLDTESSRIPLNERPIKAFWSAFRNLAGGTIKEEGSADGNDIVSDLASSFTLTELAPTPIEVQPNSVSGFLIPQNQNIGQSGIPAFTKHYLDLQIYPLNLVTFYTTFVGKTDAFRDPGGSDGSYQACRNNPSNPSCVTSEAACSSTKTGLPIPAYPFGFVKNPEVLTYYAVKGQAKFVGMFYPFADQDGVDLHAYAAAKPFGGRIGPRLFEFDPTNQTVQGRQDAAQHRSAPYVSGFNVNTVRGGSTNFRAGDPIPFTDEFWVTDTRPIGGVPGASTSVHFALPNLLYTYGNFSDIDPLQSNASQPVLELEAARNYSEGYETRPRDELIKGLYSKDQFLAFQSNLQIGTGSIINAETIDNAIEKVRAPTRYEALNYLIPTYEDNPSNFAPDTPDAVPAVSPSTTINRPDGQTHVYRLFAPLFGADTLYPELSSVSNIVQNYVQSNEPAIQVFLDSLNDVAENMRRQSQDPGLASDSQLYIDAANSIHPGNAAGLAIPGEDACPTISMASKFNQLFLGGENTRCGIIPLQVSMREYINTENSNSTGNLPYDLYYRSTYRLRPDGPSNRQLLSAFSPGERQGANNDGSLPHPFGLSRGNSLGKRNFYSTKFFALEKVEANASASYTTPGAYQESPNATPPDMLSRVRMRNPLQPNQLSPFQTPQH